MPDPADLPNELFIMVLDLALQDESDFQRLCGLSFLNRCWHAAVLGRIYSEWTFNGARQPFMTLWKYLRTMRRNPNLAAMVRTLNIGNWGFFDHAYTPGQDNALPWEEIELVKRAIHDAGIGHLESGILESLAKRDRRPLIALLLTSLPNLSTLFAHVPRSDPVLWLVLEQVITRQTNKSLSPALRHLKEVYIIQEVPVLPPLIGQDSDNDSEDLDDDRRDEELQARGKSSSLRFDGLWPILHLQSLQKLSLYDVDPDHSSTLLGPSAGASPVESLDLVVSSGYLCTIPDIQAFIRLPKTLRNFSFYVKDDILDEPDMSMITRPGIWNGLLAHKLSLETIDIYYDGSMSASRGRLGLLRDFPSLKHISVQLETLLGDCDEDSPEIPLLLKETLPSTLETLTLYDNDESNVFAELPTQLEEMISPDFPCLKGIFLEAGPGLYDHKNECIKASYQAVERKCNENGVEYEIQEPQQLKHGGLRRDLWAKTFNMREDGNERAEWFGVAPEKFRDLEELILCPAMEEELDDDDDDSDGDLHDADKWGPYRGKRRMEAKLHAVPFTDHSGKSARMIFSNFVEVPLPPLFSFAIYFTHAQAAPEHIDFEGLYEQLRSRTDIDDRFDLYFLPGASPDECMAHYSSEKAARGSYKEQIRMWTNCTNRAEARPLPGTTGQLPGMVYKYRGMSPYRGLLYICPEIDWWHGDQTLQRVSFDPRATSRAHDPVNIVTCRLSEGSPIFGDEDYRDIVSREFFEMAQWRRDDVLEPLQQATSWGWSTW